jgi:hypothetical protein
MSVAEGDRIATQAERILYQEVEYLGRVHIHYHPAEAFPPKMVDDLLPNHTLEMEQERQSIS